MSTNNPFSDANDPFGKGPANPYASPAPAPGGFSPAQGRDQAREQLKIPAIILIVLGVLWIIWRVVDFILCFFLVQQGAPLTGQMTVGLVSDVIAVILNIAVIIGAVCMLKMNSRAGAWAGAIASVIPCVGPCCLLGIPFGIWAMVIMSKPEVAQAFEK